MERHASAEVLEEAEPEAKLADINDAARQPDHAFRLAVLDILIPLPSLFGFTAGDQRRMSRAISAPSLYQLSAVLGPWTVCR